MHIQGYIIEKGEALSASTGEHLFRQADHDSRLFLVREGYLKAYYLNAEGREHVKTLVGPGSLIGSMAAMEAKGQCTFSLVALGPASLVAVPLTALSEAADGDPELARDVIDFLMAFAQRKERREYEFLCLSAEDRYRLFLQREPAAQATVSQADIAAYIGVTPQALSRIKRRIFKQP